MSHLLSPVGFMLVKQPYDQADYNVVNLEIYRSGATEYDLLIDGGYLLLI